MKTRIGETPGEAARESNEPAEAMKEPAEYGLTVQMSVYVGFERVGSIGRAS